MNTHVYMHGCLNGVHHGLALGLAWTPPSLQPLKFLKIFKKKKALKLIL